jgi:hypothetical protein
MMIEDGDLFDLRQKSLINLLDIGSGKGTSLTKSSRWRRHNREHEPSPHAQPMTHDFSF